MNKDLKGKISALECDLGEIDEFKIAIDKKADNKDDFNEKRIDMLKATIQK